MEKRHIHEPYTFAAIAFALTTGFGLAAILITVRPSKSLFGVWWIALMQTARTRAVVRLGWLVRSRRQHRVAHDQLANYLPSGIQSRGSGTLWRDAL